MLYEAVVECVDCGVTLGGEKAEAVGEDAVKPFRRPVLRPTSGCIALTVRGIRCARPHFSEVPISFTWDPVRGYGLSAPSACFCRMHDYMSWTEGEERFQIVGGWIGRAWNPDARVWTVLVTVYEARDGLDAASHWWALRRETMFGREERETYDQAIARCA